MTTQKKCEAIVMAILARCANAEAPGDVLSFGPDFGGNSLTIYDTSKGHTHVGQPDGTWDEFVDALHAQLTQGKGLSWE